ncbi:DUF2254 domain-containing protein [Stackebrandtia nassauensis]|uniref:N-6 adenine-specific DNA methylase n=1 Tax=Stackebrandtia nassauensis (strain DSM 44728 / CIP 108903 / NRRL B-16338 / NBRC 102104 / LLR-40K-21) TaxID=446470 RepID=D3Q0I7_STANL|nr:DUF2254 domain-containing protein [Stackebrandtia nassauensis]ADD41723.1 N-6 adenine-specific DNA methylase [Stackebrandtia nassauensis DSM 44728]
MAEGARRPRSPLYDHLRDNFWFAPLVALAGAVVGAQLAVRLDEFVIELADTWRDTELLYLLQAVNKSTRGIISSVTGAMLTFVGVVFSISLVALQMASSQFSPRVLRLYIRSRITKATLSVGLATFLFSLLVQLGFDDSDITTTASVPLFSSLGSVALVVTSLVLFVFYVNATLRLLRVNHVLAELATETLRVIAARRFEPRDHAFDAEVAATVRFTGGRSGVLRDVNLPRLIRLARKHDTVIEVVPKVGDFLTTGTPAIKVHGGRTPELWRVRGCLSVGSERSPRQDVGFGVRQIADIGIRALSPAVNDPTTAVAAIDRLLQILAGLVSRPDSHSWYRDRAGRLRLMVPEPSVAGLLDTAFTEFRVYGAGSPQVTRRLLSALDDLAAIAIDAHRPAIRRHRRLLMTAVAATTSRSDEREFALTPDRQGIG